jgi:hypothetical protein
MDIQFFILVVLFAAALIFFIRRLYFQFSGKKKSGCEKCNDVEKPIKNNPPIKKEFQ